MTRLRLTLLLLALGIAIPAGLIVQRALASLALENAFRHEAVARRVFDEMERALSDFLVREEARSADDYAAAEPARFADADEPFLVGWFALDARGAARVVHEPGGGKRVAAAVSAAWAVPDDRMGLDAGVLAPGRTRRIGKQGEPESPSTEALVGQQSGTAYEVLSSLNRAQQLRSERKSKLQQVKRASPSSVPARKPAGASGFAAELDMMEVAEEAEAAPAEDETFEIQRRLKRRSGNAEADASSAGGLFGDRAREARLPAAAAPLRSERSVDPMIGRPTGNGQLVLVRWVSEGGSARRQGVVVDRSALAGWLETRVLAGSGLEGRARLDFDSEAPSPLERDAVEHRYVHRFAEPFDALVARLDLAPLPGLGGAKPIYALALLLAAVAVVGLFAVLRGAKVVVDYAQKRSDFVASVSHELKTPLTAIRMYGEMLRDGLVRSNDKREEYYATIADESERLSRLIDNVLEFSRLEQDRRQLQLVVGSLDEALREAADKLRAHVEREGFQLRLEIDPGLPPVCYDRDALTQVVFNLVDNALKYARTTTRRDIVIALGQGSEGVELCVRDYGPGVPAKKLGQVFEPFYRGGDELTRTAKGTGIGLALVRELAEAMGASVRGDNPPGGGFRVAIAFAGTLVNVHPPRPTRQADSGAGR